MNDAQLEMSFSAVSVCPHAQLRKNRHQRAQWWFARMRQVVERATDWHPSPSGRPEQIWLPGTHRQVSLATAAPFSEHALAGDHL